VPTSISASGGTTYNGTALLDGDTRLAAAVLSENQHDVPLFAVGIYTVRNGTIAGGSVYVPSEGTAKRMFTEMDMFNALSAADEEWASDATPAAAPAPAPATGSAN
jgi:hypothetical protein